MTRYAVTGAGGLVGRAVVAALEQRGHRVDRWLRSDWFDLDADGQDALAPEPRWQQELAGVDVVIHLAAKVHQRHGGTQADYLRVNRDGALRLAASAAAAGVRRFVFISTVKVFGEGRTAPYTLACAPRPEDAYAESKWQAEQALLAQRSSLEVVIIRPPLVYGPGVGANFRALWRLAALPVPLPLAAVRNRRDAVSLDNLVDMIIVASMHPAAAGQTLLCSDGRAYSLAELVAAMRAARGRPRGLFPLPRRLLFTALSLLRGAADAHRLLGDFQIDIGDSRRLLDWSPPVRLEDTLRAMATAEAVAP